MLLAGLCGCAWRNYGPATVPPEAFDYELSDHLDDPATFYWLFEMERDSEYRSTCASAATTGRSST
jgi:hypothetical protein